jgi:hypothetical protein
MLLFKANLSAWPADPKQVLAIWEGAIAGSDQLFKEGQLKEVGWFTFHSFYQTLLLCSVNCIECCDNFLHNLFQ